MDGTDKTGAKQPKIGVLLVNLGTPDGTSYWPMRRYLAEFLSDRRMIEWSRLFWYPILYGIVLNTRPRRSGKLYDRIWNRERNESPLRTYTRAQGEKLAEALSDHPNVVVEWAMRYGEPCIGAVTDRLLRQGCERIVMFPLYPQYSATTTATVNDKFFEVLMEQRFMPAVRIVPSYESEPVYIEALQWAEACVFCFPTWWSGMPAILKGYFDRVWRPGIAFEQPPGGGLIKPALSNLTRMGVVTTCGSPWFYNKLLMQDPARKVLLRGLKTTCAGRGVKHLYLAQHSIYEISPEAREHFAKKVEQRFARF